MTFKQHTSFFQIYHFMLCISEHLTEDVAGALSLSLAVLLSFFTVDFEWSISFYLNKYKILIKSTVFLVLQIRPLPLLQMLFTFGSSLGIGRASEALVGLKNYAFVFVISIYPVVLNVG